MLQKKYKVKSLLLLTLTVSAILLVTIVTAKTGVQKMQFWQYKGSSGGEKSEKLPTSTPSAVTTLRQLVKNQHCNTILKVCYKLDSSEYDRQ